jgi:hypothetical protein
MTSLLCVCCSTPQKPRRAPDGYRTCDGCADRIREALVEIPSQYARLTTVEALLPGSGDEGRRGPGFGSRSPARDVVIAVTDWRTTWAEDSRLHHPPSILHAWASMVRGEVGEKPPAGPVECHVEAPLLIRRLDHVTRQEWVADMWRELREVVDQLRTIAGEPRPLPVGRCPTIVDDTTGKVCSTPLYVRAGTDTITCRGCQRQWERREWLHLGRTIGVVA